MNNNHQPLIPAQAAVKHTNYDLSSEEDNAGYFIEIVNINPIDLVVLANEEGFITPHVKYGIRPDLGPLWRIRTVSLESREAGLILGAVSGHNHFLYKVTSQKTPEGHYELVDVEVLPPTFCYEEELQQYQDNLSKKNPYLSSLYLEDELNSEDDCKLHHLALAEIKSDKSMASWFQTLSDPKVDIGKIVFAAPKSTEASQLEQKINVEYEKILAGEKRWSHFCTEGFTNSAQLLLEAVTGDVSAIYRIISAKDARGLYDIVDIQPFEACNYSMTDAEMLKILLPDEQ